MNASTNRRGQLAVGSRPVSGSISTNVMPGGTLNGTLARPAVARIMNSVQMGSAAWAPLRPSGLIVVEADPHHGEQVGSEADKPGVAQIVGGAGLACSVEGEARGARAGARPLVEDAP